VSTFNYRLSTEDLIALRLHHALNSETGRSQLRRARINTTIAVLAASIVVIWIASGNPVTGAVMALLAAVAVWFAFPWSWRRALDGSLRQMAASDGLGLPGDRSLSTSDDGVAEKGEGPQVSAKWSAVERVDTTPAHIFIYAGRGAEFVVPRSIGPEQVDALIAEIEAHRGRSHT